jgi:predicted metalloprotease
MLDAEAAMKLIATIILILGLATAACTSTGNTSDVSASPESPAEASTPAPQPPAAPQTTASTSSNGCPNGDLEGCFGYRQMGEYVDAVFPMVARFFETQFPDVSAPRDVVFVPAGQAARGACGVSTATAYEYCAADQTIYVGQNLVWAFYRQSGDAAPALALAHEWGHHLQFAERLPAFGSVSASIAVENQADCIAGAWAKYAKEQGWLQENDDLQDVQKLIEMIGSQESSDRDHGTTAERLEAFQRSYAGGIKACNAFFPRSPIA